MFSLDIETGEMKVIVRRTGRSLAKEAVLNASQNKVLVSVVNGGFEVWDIASESLIGNYGTEAGIFCWLEID